MIDPIQNRIEGIPRPSLTAAGLFVLLAALGQWATSALELALPNASVALLIALYYVPFVGVPLLLYARRRPGLGEAMRLDAPPALPMLSVALLALMSVYVASALSALWGAGLDALGLKSPGSLPPPQNERELISSILLSAALPAVAEEMLFRGVVLSAWESRGTALAIGVSTALFALLHANLYGLPAFLLVGAVAGFAAWALHSVYAAIAYHTIYNAACLAIPYDALAGAGDGDAAGHDGRAADFAVAARPRPRRRAHPPHSQAACLRGAPRALVRGAGDDRIDRHHTGIGESLERKHP